MFQWDMLKMRGRHSDVLVYIHMNLWVSEISLSLKKHLNKDFVVFHIKFDPLSLPWYFILYPEIATSVYKHDKAMNKSYSTILKRWKIFHLNMSFTGKFWKFITFIYLQWLTVSWKLEATSTNTIFQSNLILNVTLNSPIITCPSSQSDCHISILQLHSINR